MKDHSDGPGCKKLSASFIPQGRQIGRGQQRTKTDLTLDSKLRNVTEKESAATPHMSTGMGGRSTINFQGSSVQ